MTVISKSDLILHLQFSRIKRELSSPNWSSNFPSHSSALTSWCPCSRKLSWSPSLCFLSTILSESRVPGKAPAMINVIQQLLIGRLITASDWLISTLITSHNSLPPDIKTEYYSHFLVALIRRTRKSKCSLENCYGIFCWKSILASNSIKYGLSRSYKCISDNQTDMYVSV